MHKSFPTCNLLLYQAPPALVESQMKQILPAFFTCSFAQHVKHKYWSKVPGLRRYRPLFWRLEQISATHVRCGPSLFFMFELSLERYSLASGIMGTTGMAFPDAVVPSPVELRVCPPPAGCVFSSSSPKNPIATYIFHRKRVKNRAKKTREHDRIEKEERERLRVGHKVPVPCLRFA